MPPAKRGLNGYSKWVLSALGIMVPLLAGVCAGVQNKVVDLDMRDSQQRERVAVIEAKMTDLQQRLIRIEDKLDRLTGRPVWGAAP